MPRHHTEIIFLRSRLHISENLCNFAHQMCDLETFQINLKTLGQGVTRMEFDVNDDFFRAIDTPEVQRGELKVELEVDRRVDLFELNFHVKGSVSIPCDLCLDEMQQSVDTDHRLIVRFGEANSENEEMVIVEEESGVLDLSWFVYETIALAIPIRHVHESGQCNPEMIDSLKAHVAHTDGNGPTEQAVDPRWMKLKQIKNNIKD